MKEVKTVDELNGYISDNNVVVLKFGAEWCGPCRSLKPILEKLSGEISGACFLEADVEEADELAKVFGVMNIPAIFIIKGGEPVESLVGYQSEASLRETIEKII